MRLIRGYLNFTFSRNGSSRKADVIAMLIKIKSSQS